MKTAALVLAGLIMLLGSLQVPCWAKTFLVPEEYIDLERALYEATYGDTILVSPGKYKVQATLRSGVTIHSTHGPDSTVLWNQRWHILKLVDCDLETTISGFTFEGKGSNVCLACTTGAPVITGNVIKNSWDGINIFKCNAFVHRNTITGCNRGIHLDYSDPELLENEFRNNSDAISMISSSPVIAQSTFERNGRAILIHGHSYPVIGGSLEAANNILGNTYTVYNRGLQIEGTEFTDRPEVAIATHNYWGGDCPKESRFRGDVIYAPWTNAEHDTLLEKCPPEVQPEEGKTR
jgi:parallel beta-helix repeat protein